MKRFFRLSAAVLLVVMLCISFCSCKELDALREEQAFWGEVQGTVYFRGNWYKLLPACRDLHIETEGIGYVTNRDVPVLLSGSIGVEFWYSKDQIWLESGYWGDGYGSRKTYCREDKYDEYVAKIGSYHLDRYCVYDPEWTFDDNGDVADYSSFKLIPDDVADAVNAVIENTEPEKSDISGDVRVIQIYRCDETLLFLDQYSLITIGMTKGGIAVVTESENGTQVYTVSEEYAGIIEDFYHANVNKLGYSYHYYYGWDPDDYDDGEFYPDVNFEE